MYRQEKQQKAYAKDEEKIKLYMRQLKNQYKRDRKLMKQGISETLINEMDERNAQRRREEEEAESGSASASEEEHAGSGSDEEGEADDEETE